MDVTTLRADSQANTLPSRDYLEVKRRNKLSRALNEIGDFLAHREVDGQFVIEDVALLVAELAVLDRVAPDDNLSQYFWRMVHTLRVEPWGDAAIAWERVRPAIETFQSRWAAHQRQALLKSEPAAHRHYKLVDLTSISHRLGLTRPVMREVFGSKTTALPPIRMAQSPFTNAERAEIRTLARRLDFTAEHLRDLVLVEGNEVAFCDKVLARELMLVEQDRIDAARIEHASDLTISRSIGRNIGKIVRKPGPKAQPVTVGSLIAETANCLRVSSDTVKRELKALKTVLHLSSAPEMSEPSAELHPYYRGVAPELLRSWIPGFSPSSDTGITPSKLDVTAAMLEIIRGAYRRPKTYAGATRESYSKVKDRRMYDPEVVALVKRWHLDTRGATLSSCQIWHLGAKSVLHGYVVSAKQWEKDQLEMAKALAEDAENLYSSTRYAKVSPHVEHRDCTARPVRAGIGDGAEAAPEPQGEEACQDAHRG